MFGELLADCFGTAGIGFDERDVGRRRWRCVTEEFLLHVNAAHDGRGIHAIRRGSEERGLGEQAAARRDRLRDHLRVRAEIAGCHFS